jgi:hypothetical protein
LALKFKETLPLVIKELEAKYPGLDLFDKDKKKGDLFFGEIRTMMDYVRGEEEEDGIANVDVLKHYLEETENELNATKREVEEYLNQKFTALSSEMEIYPRFNNVEGSSQQESQNEEDQDDQ